MHFNHLLSHIGSNLERASGYKKGAFADHFIDELRARFQSMEEIATLKKFPSDTLFTLDRYEGNYAVCENRTTGEMIDIPKSVVSSVAKESDILRREGDLFVVDVIATKTAREAMRKLLDEKQPPFGRLP